MLEVGEQKGVITFLSWSTIFILFFILHPPPMLDPLLPTPTPTTEKWAQESKAKKEGSYFENLYCLAWLGCLATSSSNSGGSFPYL